MDTKEKKLAEAFGRLVYCNPFRQERIEAEKEVLGADFAEQGAAWNLRHDWEGSHPHVVLLRERAVGLADSLRHSWAGRSPSGKQRELYEGVAFFQLFHHFSSDFDRLLEASLERGHKVERVGFFGRFRDEADRCLVVRGEPLFPDYRPEHLFAFFFQIRRAFFQIFRHLVGRSRPAAELRANVWESIFTHDLRRFRRSLFDRMGDMATLITGPSGTGKELVARAIGLSRFIPFAPKTQRFAEDFAGSFFPLNLSALSMTLLESELFGHSRGAFTGAVQDRAGWLEVCPSYGTVFLDEIGDVDPLVQVKLLRVLQERTFQRIGESQTRVFSGKIIAATNRNLAREMAEGTFREDFYYRLCSDLVATPSLREQLADSPEELGHVVLFAARRIVGEEEASAFAGQAEGWIRKNLGSQYAWPGNFRELEQCLRNLTIRGVYRPPQVEVATMEGSFVPRLLAGEMTAAELMEAYCSRLYAECGNYGEVARRLAVDRRTVRKYVMGKADP
jgi:transcriptional regulator with AAA-type ATPase domain